MELQQLLCSPFTSPSPLFAPVSLSSYSSGAQQLIITEASLSGYQINSLVDLKVKGTFQTLAEGDCIKISYPQPYTNSKGVFDSRQKQSSQQFYVPFATGSPSLSGDASPSGSLTQIDEYSVQIKLSTGGSNFAFTVSNFKVPYSLILGTTISVAHFKGCGKQPSPCSNGLTDPIGCRSDNKFEFTAVPTNTLKAPKTEILDAQGGTTKNMVGSSNGYVTFSFEHSSAFPVYGGLLEFTLPQWFRQVSANPLYLLYLDDSCTSEQIEISKSYAVLDTYIVMFSQYTPAPNNEIVIKCSNFRNPPYRKVVTGFGMKIWDREDSRGLVAQFPEWQLDLSKDTSMNVVTLEENIQFLFYQGDQNTPSPQVPVQSTIAMEFIFNIPFPIEGSSCYLRIDFPIEFPLKDFDNIIFVGGGVLIDQLGSPNIQSSVFKQYLTSENYLIIQGCPFIQNVVGTNQKIQFKIAKILSPLAKKTTGTLSFNLYKTFDQDSNSLTNHLLTKQATVSEDSFKSGSLTEGDFQSPNKFVQATSIHTIRFRLKNALPPVGLIYSSRIVVMMPSIMSAAETEPSVADLNGVLNNPSIQRESTFPGCETTVCYSISHQNKNAVPQNTLMRLRISGTNNQESVEEAGTFFVQTQIFEVKNPNVFFNIDAGTFNSKYISTSSGISQTMGKQTTFSKNYTYAQETVYTFYFDLNAYIPQWGFLLLQLPPQIQIYSDPSSTISSSAALSFSSFKPNLLTLKADKKILSGSYTLQVGKILNPRTVFETDVFNMSSYDQSNYLVASGSLDNVKMTQVGNFSDLRIERTDQTNGKISDYKVIFTSEIPVLDGDVFYFKLPSTISTPSQPICLIGSCLKNLSCNSEKGRIVVQFLQVETSCNNTVSKEFSFTIKDVKNAPSMVPSDMVQAYWKSSKYIDVANFGGETRVTNLNPGALRENDVHMTQSSQEFKEKSIYFLTFTPTNPLSKIAWIRIDYPYSVSFDEKTFVDNCVVVITKSYSGSSHCFLDTKNRRIWMYDLFTDQDQYTSVVYIELTFFNPSNNFANSSNIGSYFQIYTYDFDLKKDFNLVLTSRYSQESIDNLVKAVLPDPLKYVYPIDQYFETDLVPKLKCNYPCFTCLDADPNYCTSCWGSTPLKFLQPQFAAATQTCQKSCDDGYSTNGNKLSNSEGDYYNCERCDLSCETCQGQGKTTEDIGSQGDIQLCITCPLDFPYFLRDEKKCLTICNAGYYAKVEPIGKEDGECKLCQQPCLTCRKCTFPNDQYCTARDGLIGDDPSARFCMSCSQDQFFPDILKYIDDIQTFVTNQAGMVTNKAITLTNSQKDFIQTRFSGITINQFKNTKISDVIRDDATTFWSNVGLRRPNPSVIEITSSTTFTELYSSQYSKYNFAKQNLHNNDCIDFCPDGFASVNGKCQSCLSPCQTCYREVSRCTFCRQDTPQKYLFAYKCFEVCPSGTVKDENNKKCLPCQTGCVECDINDQDICYECEDDLVLFKGRCLGACPDGYKKSFDGKRCEPAGTLPVIWVPWMILTLLSGCIAIGGEFSSRNTSKQHKIILTFYCLVGVIDVLALWTQLILTFFQGQIWMLVFSVIPLGVNYYINYRYKKLWDQIDPEDPTQFDRLTFPEILRINECDENIDGWQRKYPKAAKYTKNIVFFLSHKFFQFPFTHFFGYLHFTLRTQDYKVIWEVDEREYKKNQKSANSLYRGRLVPRSKMQEFRFKNEDYEGGEEVENIKNVQFPRDFPRHPEDREPDNRVRDLFRFQVKADLLGMRVIMILGNLIMILSSFSNQDPFQLQINSIENLVLAIIMVILQIVIWKRWEQFRLPLKMRDFKANYLFKGAKAPNNINKHLDLIDRENLLPEQNKYLPFYKFHDIFLDNKLEELLNIFGRRQCKSCIEFSTGQELEEDPRKVRSWPLSPRAEKLYKGLQGDFDLIDFQLQDNVYHDIQEPTAAFESLNRDYSSFGVQVFSFDVLEALNRKGGELITPDVDGGSGRKKSLKKRRGRKNKYYKQIDQEDDEEANKMSDSDRDGLDHVQEEEFEDEDDEDLKKKLVQEKRLEKMVQDAQDLQTKGKQETDALQKKLKNDEASGKKNEAEKREKERKEKEKRDKEEEERRRKEEKDKNDRAKKEEKERKEKEEKEKELRDEEDKIAKEAEDKKRKNDEAIKAEEARKKQEEENLKEDILKHHSPLKDKNQLKNDSLKKSVDLSKKGVGQQQLGDSKKSEGTKAKEETKDGKGKGKEEGKDGKGKGKEEGKDGKGRGNEESKDRKGQGIDEVKEGKGKGKEDTKDGKSRENDLDKSAVDDSNRVLSPEEMKQALEAPPNPNRRTFNENDILGDFDRDHNGNLLLGDPQGDGYIDKQGRPTNQRGYLIDPVSKDIVNNLDGRKMFGKSQMDENGNLPHPFQLERWNFNPHDIKGDFDYDRKGKAMILRDKHGKYVDKRGNVVNKNGYRITDPSGHIIDRFGRKKLDKSQLAEDGDIPKLYSYNGRRYNIQDAIGILEKDDKGQILPRTDKRGRLVDKVGRQVNKKGYLVDDDGNVIDSQGRILFEKRHLVDDEIPKIFPFSKINIKSLIGDFDMDPLGNPVLDRNQKGELVDRRGRRVNPKGYLIDDKGNVINESGKIVFPRGILDPDEDIPKVFRTGLLKSDSESSLSRLMSEIEKNQVSEFDQDEKAIQRQIQSDAKGKKKGARSQDTSEGSQMGVTPTDYNKQNQRIDDGDIMQAIGDEEEDDYGSQDYGFGGGYGSRGSELGGAGGGVGLVAKKKKKKTKKKKKKPQQELEDPSLRDILLAGAYGGVAQPKVKRAGVKYTTDLDAGLKEMVTPQILKQASNQNLGSSQNLRITGMESNRGRRASNDSGLRGKSDAGSMLGSRLGSTRKQDSLEKKKSTAKKKKAGKVQRDADFEKMFGKDIDEFLEDSEWDIESIDKMSRFSKNSKRSVHSAAQSSKLRDLENIYLKRQEANKQTSGRKQTSARKQSGLKNDHSAEPRVREMQDRFVDDPGFIHRGIDSGNQSLSAKKQTKKQTVVHGDQESHHHRHEGSEGGHSYHVSCCGHHHCHHKPALDDGMSHASSRRGKSQK